MRKSFATTISFLTLAFAGAAHATVVNVSAANATGTTVTLGAGTYTVSYAGIAGGGIYDTWSPWSSSTGCDSVGANCATGYSGAFAIDFGFGTGTFSGVDGFQYGYAPVAGNSGLYHTASNALAAYATLPLSFAPLPVASNASAYSLVGGPVSFTLGSAQQVRFFVLDYPYSDNRDGISLDVALPATGAVPEPASWAMMLAGFGIIGWSLRRRSGAIAQFA